MYVIKINLISSGAILPIIGAGGIPGLSGKLQELQLNREPRTELLADWVWLQLKLLVSGCNPH